MGKYDLTSKQISLLTTMLLKNVLFTCEDK